MVSVAVETRTESTGFLTGWGCRPTGVLLLRDQLSRSQVVPIPTFWVCWSHGHPFGLDATIQISTSLIYTKGKDNVYLSVLRLSGEIWFSN